MTKAIPGSATFTEKFLGVINSQQWEKAQADFCKSTSILCVGNGGNLAVCDHGAIDISRLTN